MTSKIFKLKIKSNFYRKVNKVIKEILSTFAYKSH